MHTQTQKTQESSSAKPAGSLGTSASAYLHPVLQLQQQLGNRTVQRLLRSKRLQAKLTIGRPDDKYEQEADRVADQVMLMPDPTATEQSHSNLISQVPDIQRVCPQCEDKLQRQTTDEIEEEEDELLQAREVPGQVPEVSNEVESTINNLRGGGQPLSDSVRDYIEPRFRRDFSQVRVHTDTQATKAAESINARAFTVGKDIVFATGQYSPETGGGKRLLAHELTHVIQQQSIKNLTQASSRSDGNENSCKVSPTTFSVLNSSNQQNCSHVGDAIQRACGPTAIGTVGECEKRGGDITDYGGSSDRLVLFKVNCDEFLPEEAARLIKLAKLISPGDIVEIDGFASEEGDADFNDNLSCARAHSAKAELMNHLQVSTNIKIFYHGATQGDRSDRRSVVISITPSAPIPTPAPPVRTAALDKLDEELNSDVYVSDAEALKLLGQLNSEEKKQVLSRYKEKIADGVDDETMVEALDILQADYETRKDWLKAVGADVYDIRIGEDFAEKATGCTLDKELKERVRSLCEYLITHLLVWRYISYNEGCRTKEKAHRWSTAFHILSDDVTLEDLQAHLPPVAEETENDKSNDKVRDQDENLWYERGWSLQQTKAQAIKNYDNGKEKKPPAYEGYAVGDKRRIPNCDKPPVSQHTKGQAMDVGIMWNKDIASGRGDAWSDVANEAVKKFSLKRPLDKNNPYGAENAENWHFEKE